jgi:hypothetical protein
MITRRFVGNKGMMAQIQYISSFTAAKIPKPGIPRGIGLFLQHVAAGNGY